MENKQHPVCVEYCLLKCRCLWKRHKSSACCFQACGCSYCSGTKSYSAVCQEIKDALLPAKLAVFLSIAKLLQPFLVSFRTDAPMIPFLPSEESWWRWWIALWEHFIKSDILSNTRNVHSIDVTEHKNRSTYTKLEIGFSARKILKEVQAEKRVNDGRFCSFV